MISVSLPEEAIRRCSRDPAFLADVETTFAWLDREIADRGARCRTRGDCCRFASFNHRLFVTTTELAYFLGSAPDAMLIGDDRWRCPYQQDGRCTVRRARPAGCRIFFCEPRAQGWQPALTEDVLRHLADIGEAYGLGYAYVEWLAALDSLHTA